MFIQEFNVRKRLDLEELQKEMLDEAKDDGKLSAEQADWMMREHQKNQIEVKRVYGDEMARQRMILNEKLERRRLMAQAKVYTIWISNITTFISFLV